MAGYSPGSRSHPHFDWVKNLRSKKLSKEAISHMNYRTSSAFAFFWNLCQAWLPAEIIADFDEFLDTIGILAMDSNRRLPMLDGDYEATVDGLTYEFNNVRLAPPQGVMAVNYSRYGLKTVLECGLELLSSAIHQEHQPHQWAISLNTVREGSAASGGSFYFAQYGVRVLQATNTLIAFKPCDAHGTSLLHRTPADTAWYRGTYQMGLAIISSPRLASTFLAYKKGQMKHCDALDSLEEQEGDIEYEWGCGTSDESGRRFSHRLRLRHLAKLASK